VVAGLKTDVQGCILLGLERGSLDGQRAVLQSRKALARFESFLGQEAFGLDIYWKHGFLE
jgi:hypothetical protein